MENKYISNNETINVPDPTSYYCKVWAYRASHSLLVIRAYKGDFLTGDTIYLIFGEVSYYEGSLTWKNAEYSIASDDETLNLFQELGWGTESDIPIESYLDDYKLYKFTGENRNTLILASILYTSRDLPEEFS